MFKEFLWTGCTGMECTVELERFPEDFTIIEKAPTRAIS